ncbi:MarC family protein [Thalassobaculum sp.]|uniref:MarC family protein n=1 Tax=Thalassobaculum sp. TaxID=2022740 RepID=UPI0032ED35DB
MDLTTLSVPMAVNILILLLIGMGPKIALVPFLEKTKGMTPEVQRKIGTTMVITATVTALVLLLVGSLLTRLLHISTAAVAVAGGIVLMLLALKMTAGPSEGHAKEEEAAEVLDHSRIAIYPLAVPYLLNPVGIVLLIVASVESHSLLIQATVGGLVLLVGAFDMLVFRNIDILSKRLNPTTLVISEVVFGILLAAVAVELTVAGLTRYGIIEKL